MSGISYCKYLSHDGIELFTVVCLPSEGGKFPTLIHREPYVTATEETYATASPATAFAGWTRYAKNASLRLSAE